MDTSNKYAQELDINGEKHTIFSLEKLREGARTLPYSLKLLLENGRVAVLPEISAQFEALKAKVENSIDAVITAAAPLSAAQEQAIASSLAARLGRDVRISTEVDENLIGGAVIRAGDVVIDGSLRAGLEGLANALTK
jgi:F-type H+-transporting ATPase subunit delta